MKKKEPEEESRQAEDAHPAEGPLPAEEVVPEEGEEGPRTRPEVEVLGEELALLETQLENMRDRYIRAVADLDNARKRAKQAIADARKQAVSGVLLELLTLMDSFERALETADPGPRAPAETRAVYGGIELIYRQLVSLLERRGVKPIEAMGQPFDPTRHEAVAQVPTEEQKEGTVALEMQKGYLHGNQVLRYSRVGVAVQEPDREKEGE